MTEIPMQTAPANAPARTAGDTYRRLRFAGLTAKEAGTLVGRLNGLGAVHAGWSIAEVEHLLFVRELVRSGRIGS